MASNYNYKDIPLDEYCKQNNLNIKTQRNRVRNYIKKYPELSKDEAVIMALDNCGKKYAKYVYEGITLAQYCRKNNIEYSKIISRIECIKNKNEISDTEATKIAIENYHENGIKLFYQNIPLVLYCEKNPEYKYGNILSYINRKKKSNPTMNTQEIVDSYFSINHYKQNKNLVEGKDLKTYCNENNISYNTIMSKLSIMRKSEEFVNLTDGERLEIALASYQKKNLLFYDDISLKEFCEKNNQSYNTIYSFVRKLMQQNNDISFKEAVDIANSSILKSGIKYNYQGTPLVIYCKENNLNAKYIREKIFDMVNKKKYTEEEAIKKAIEYYEEKKHFHKINSYFEMLKTEKNSEKEFQEMLEYLNIDKERYNDIFSIVENHLKSISLIWYFYDSADNDKKTLSIKRLKEIFGIVSQLKEDINYKLISLDIKILYGIYKCGLFDTRYYIIKKNENFNFYNIKKFNIKYGINLNRDEIEELNKDCNLYLIELLEKINNNKIGQVITYFNKGRKGFILNKIINKFPEKIYISLDEMIGENQLVSEKIGDKKNEQDEFSDEMLEIIRELPECIQKYIFYKYHECLPDEKISELLNLDINSLIFLEDEMKYYLSHNQVIKNKVKKYIT